MATYTIYNETTQTTKSVTVNFLANILAGSTAAFSSCTSYYFQITTGAKTTDGGGIGNVLVLSLDELALNGVNQRRTGSTAAYADIDDMIQDYLYDFVNGHAADLYGSGVTERAPMQF
jgi:hypothetical protein